MLKYLLVFGFLLLYLNQTFALSCMPPEPLPPLSEAVSEYETIGILEIQKLLEDKHDTSEVLNPMGTSLYTIHQVKVIEARKGLEKEALFDLKINSTSWIRNSTLWEEGTQIPFASIKSLEDGVLEIDRDFGCGRDDWYRYDIDEILKLDSKEEKPVEALYPEIPKSFWDKIKSWFPYWF